jgi:hypothetical protein
VRFAAPVDLGVSRDAEHGFGVGAREPLHHLGAHQVPRLAETETARQGGVWQVQAPDTPRHANLQKGIHALKGFEWGARVRARAGLLTMASPSSEAASTNASSWEKAASHAYAQWVWPAYVLSAWHAQGQRAQD